MTTGIDIQPVPVFLSQQKGKKWWSRTAKREKENYLSFGTNATRNPQSS